MRINTLKFGPLDVPAKAILHFPDGLVGFPQFRRGCLLPHPGSPGVRWLQCLDDPALVFLTIEPHLMLPDYDVELPEADSASLRLTRAADAAVLTTITLSQEPPAVTANLLAPIIINTVTRRARQVILDTDRYLTKHLIGCHLTDGLHAGLDAKSR